MGMREKLIELLTAPILMTESVEESLADHLIDNGVTIQKWISVKERLPELHTKVLCCGIKGGRFIAELGTWGHEKHLCWDKKNGKGCPTVTHWMPMPKPPKEENDES